MRSHLNAEVGELKRRVEGGHFTLRNTTQNSITLRLIP